MSGTGTIYDIQGEVDRIIWFPENKDFALVKAAYYQDEDHQFFRDLESARYALAESEYSAEIVEVDGSRYFTGGYIGTF